MPANSIQSSNKPVRPGDHFTAIGSASPKAITMHSGGLDAATSRSSGSENFKVTWKAH